MSTKTWLAGAAVLVLIAGPSAAQNAHRYQGGPNTVVPHSVTDPGSEAPVTEKATKKKVAKRNASSRGSTTDGPSARPTTGHTGHHPGH